MHLFEVTLETKVKDLLNLVPELDTAVKNGVITKPEVYELVHKKTSKQEIQKKIQKMHLKISPIAVSRLVNFADRLSGMDTTGLEDEDVVVRQAGISQRPKPSQLALSNKQQLPVEIPKKGQIATKTKLKINWMNVSDLPGYMQQSIRMAVKVFLAPFTTANLSEMDILACLTSHAPARAIGHSSQKKKEAKGMGPSNLAELNAVKKEVTTRGVKLKDAEITGEHNRLIPGYSIHYSLWNMGDRTYLFVQDAIDDVIMGYYVYNWDIEKTKIDSPAQASTFKDYITHQ